MTVSGNGGQPQASEIAESLRALLRAGLELGVGEAARKLQEILGADSFKGADRDRLLSQADLAGFIESVRADPNSILQMVKEVWSRGGPKEKKTAVEALGRALARLVPHRALAVARDLAIMARNPKEADWVGTEAIGPLLDANPAMTDRVRQFLQEAQPWLVRAAIASVVYLVARKRKHVALGVELVLLAAEAHQKEIRDGVRWAMREIGKIEPKGAAQIVLNWVKSNPSRERAQTALRLVSTKVDAASKQIQRIVQETAAKRAAPSTPAGAAGQRPKAKKVAASR